MARTRLLHPLGGNALEENAKRSRKETAQHAAAAAIIFRPVAALIQAWPRVSKSPYEKQGILEELIKLLQAAV